MTSLLILVFWEVILDKIVEIINRGMVAGTSTITAIIHGIVFVVGENIVKAPFLAAMAVLISVAVLKSFEFLLVERQSFSIASHSHSALI